MESLKQRRKQLVRTLRECAKLTGAETERDDASRNKVRALYDRVLAKGCATTAAKATEAFQSYEATWGDGKADQEKEPKDLATVRLRGKSFLFSYKWGFFNKAFPDGTPPPGSHAELWSLWLTCCFTVGRRGKKS